MQREDLAYGHMSLASKGPVFVELGLKRGRPPNPRGGCAGSLKDGIQRKRKKRTRAAVKKGSRGLRSRFVLVFSSRAVCRHLRLFGDRRAGCLILDCSIHPLFLMYSAVYASSRASGAPKTTNKTPRLPSAVSGGNKAPWRLGTPYGAKSAPRVNGIRPRSVAPGSRFYMAF